MRSIIGLMLICCLTAPAWAGFDEGMAAWKRGNFKAAFQEFKPLAEQGNAQAQNYLGYMYENGEGVAQDDTAAAQWYMKAAEQGVTESQNNLGFMYAGGRGGLEQSNIEALKWLHIAAERGDPQATFNRKSIKGKLSAEEIAEAEARARKWLDAHPK